jgi:hypothetical protein
MTRTANRNFPHRTTANEPCPVQFSRTDFDHIEFYRNELAHWYLPLLNTNTEHLIAEPVRPLPLIAAPETR